MKYLSSNCRELKNTNRTKLIIKVVTRHQTGCYPAICPVTSMNVDWRSFLALGRLFALILCGFLLSFVFVSPPKRWIYCLLDKYVNHYTNHF